jgi:hypothetical protein
VGRAQQLRAPARKEVILPSGATAVVQPINLLPLLRRGILPSANIVDERGAINPSAMNPDLYSRFLEAVVIEGTVDPKIVAGEPSDPDAEVGIYEIRNDDLMALVSEIMEISGLGENIRPFQEQAPRPDS